MAVSRSLCLCHTRTSPIFFIVSFPSLLSYFRPGLFCHILLTQLSSHYFQYIGDCHTMSHARASDFSSFSVSSFLSVLISSFPYFFLSLFLLSFLQLVLNDLVGEKLPALQAHFKYYAVDISTVTFNWLITVFVDAVPFEVRRPVY